MAKFTASTEENPREKRKRNHKKRKDRVGQLIEDFSDKSKEEEGVVFGTNDIKICQEGTRDEAASSDDEGVFKNLKLRV